MSFHSTKTQQVGNGSPYLLRPNREELGHSGRSQDSNGQVKWESWGVGGNVHRGPPYLGKGQTVLILVSVLHLEIIKCFALGRGLRQGPNALDVAGRQEAVSPMQLPMVPVLIHSAPQNDDVALAELEVARFFPLVTVERLPIGKLGESLKAKHSITLLNMAFLLPH